jgi:sugar/nucleoside kinase (ribokinase family)
MTPPESRPFDLLVAGELNPDVLVSGPDVGPAFGQVEKLVEGIRLTVGSSSAITACGAARLGLRVAFVGVVGRDLFGRSMLEALEERGVDVGACRVDPDLPTGATVILSRRSDRAILTALGTIEALRGEDLDDALLARARHLHVGSVYLQDRLRAELPSVFTRARRLGLTTSFDPNWDPTGAWDGGLDALLATADVVLPNREEARRMAGRDDDLAAAGVLHARGAAAGVLHARGAAAGGTGAGPLVAVKLGADGGLATDGARMIRVTAPAVPLVDTTGAGDAFDAGFLAGWLGGRDIAEALRLAVACGALSLRAVGGTEGQATLAEGEALAATLTVTEVRPGEVVP